MNSYLNLSHQKGPLGEAHVDEDKTVGKKVEKVVHSLVTIFHFKQ